MKKTTLSSGTRPFCSTKRCQEERRRTGFGYAPVRRVDRQNVHALSVASTASNFIVWAPSGNGKASRTWVGTERVYPIWVGFSFFVKRCTCSILFQETQEFLWREKARVLGVILIDTRKQTQRERERERERCYM